MFLKGSLATMSVSEVLQWIETNRKSGTLQIEMKSFRKMLYFRDGFIFFASSNREGERLGQFLIYKGVLNERKLSECLQNAKQAGDLRKLSEIVVEMGFLTQEQLLGFLSELIQEIVYDCFLYESGDFEFSDGALPEEVLTGFGLSPQEVAMEGLRRLDEYLRDQESLPNETNFLMRTEVSLERIGSVLGSEGKAIFKLADGTSSTNEIIEKSPFPVRRTQTVLLSLISGGAVVPIPGRVPPEKPQEADFSPLSAMTVKPSTPTTSASSGGTAGSAAAASPGTPEERVGPPDTRLFVLVSLEKPDDLRALDADEGYVLSRIFDRCTVRELLVMAGTGKERGYQILANLIRKGYVEARRQS
jgi:hypothetical protein